MTSQIHQLQAALIERIRETDDLILLQDLSAVLQRQRGRVAVSEEERRFVGERLPTWIAESVAVDGGGESYSTADMMREFVADGHERA